MRPSLRLDPVLRMGAPGRVFHTLDHNFAPPHVPLRSTWG